MHVRDRAAGLDDVSSRLRKALRVKRSACQVAPDSAGRLGLLLPDVPFTNQLAVFEQLLDLAID